MSRTRTTLFARLAVLLLAFSILGCNRAVTGNEDENEQNEVPSRSWRSGPTFSMPTT